MSETVRLIVSSWFLCSKCASLFPLDYTFFFYTEYQLIIIYNNHMNMYATEVYI